MTGKREGANYSTTNFDISAMITFSTLNYVTSFQNLNYGSWKSLFYKK